MSRIFNWLKDEKNRAVVGWIGGGASVAAAALWAAYLHFSSAPELQSKQVPAQIESDCSSVAIAGNVSGATITAGNSSDCVKRDPKAPP